MKQIDLTVDDPEKARRNREMVARGEKAEIYSGFEVVTPGELPMVSLRDLRDLRGMRLLPSWDLTEQEGL